MIKDIYYENSQGVRLDLLQAPYLLQTGELFDYEWSYAERENGGTRISRFFKDIKERSLTLSIQGETDEEFDAAVDHFHDVVDYDVVNKSPGRLYFGESYLRGFVVSATKNDWESDCASMDVDLAFICEEGYWISEQRMSFSKPDPSTLQAKLLTYPFTYTATYGVEQSSAGIVNPHSTACDFELVVFGPCISPAVNIDGENYEVQVTLGAEDYLTVNTIRKRITCTRADGSEENCFYLREPRVDFFRKIPPGRHEIVWDGSFGCDLTLIHRRSEPAWN